jgi:FtsP/CotA-like multicopper oxidase with cupredoxin domain
MRLGELVERAAPHVDLAAFGLRAEALLLQEPDEPNKAFVDVQPGKSFSFNFRANDPGVFMYHCGTKPVLAHIANGMYGAIVIDPANPKLLPPVHHAYVIVSGEWYLNSAGEKSPSGFDMVKAHQMTPDWVTFNGYAGQYVSHPLEAHPGHTARLYVVDAGPSFDTDFHVVGTILQRAWINGDVVDPPQHGIQTATVPGRWRRHLRRDDLQAGPLPVRHALVRERGHGRRGAAQRR